MIELGKRYLNWFVAAARTRFYCLRQPVSDNAAHLFYLIVGQCIHSATAQRVGGHRGTRCISPDFFFLEFTEFSFKESLCLRDDPLSVLQACRQRHCVLSQATQYPPQPIQ